MKGKKNETTGNNDQEQAILEELFSSNDDDPLLDLPDNYLAPIGELITYSAAVGGMATFYRSSVAGSIGISVRLGQRKRGLVISGDDIDLRFLIQFIDGFKRIYLNRAQLRNATKLDEQAVKSKKKKS